VPLGVVSGVIQHVAPSPGWWLSCRVDVARVSSGNWLSSDHEARCLYSPFAGNGLARFLCMLKPNWPWSLNSADLGCWTQLTSVVELNWPCLCSRLNWGWLQPSPVDAWAAVSRRERSWTGVLLSHIRESAWPFVKWRVIFPHSWVGVIVRESAWPFVNCRVGFSANVSRRDRSWLNGTGCRDYSIRVSGWRQGDGVSIIHFYGDGVDEIILSWWRRRSQSVGRVTASPLKVTASVSGWRQGDGVSIINCYGDGVDEIIWSWWRRQSESDGRVTASPLKVTASLSGWRQGDGVSIINFYGDGVDEIILSWWRRRSQSVGRVTASPLKMTASVSGWRQGDGVSIINFYGDGVYEIIFVMVTASVSEWRQGDGVTVNGDGFSVRVTAGWRRQVFWPVQAPRVTPIVSVWRRETQEDEDSLLMAIVLNLVCFGKANLTLPMQAAA
jgi:hypothetical protein